MVPAAAVLVVQDDDRRVRPQRAVLHGMHDVGGVLLAGQNGGIARMLVELAGELDERDLRQLAGRQVDVELRLVLQLRRGADVLGIQSPVVVEGGIFGEVGKRLVVVLKQLARLACHGIVPAAGVPTPGNARRIQAIADGLGVAGLLGIDVVDGVQPLIGGHLLRVRPRGRAARC